MFETRRRTHLLTIVSLCAILLLAVAGCDKNRSAENPEKEATETEATKTAVTEAGGEDSCEDAAMAMVGTLEPYLRNQPGIDVPFALPEATGSYSDLDVAVLAGPDVVRVGDKTFAVPDDANPIEDGGYPDAVVAQVQQALVTEAKENDKEQKILNEVGPLEIELGVHPDISAGAVEPFFSKIDRPSGFQLLAFDAEAPDMPERRVHEEIEPLLQELEAAEDEAEIKKRTRSLEKRVAGDCEIAFFRAWVGKKTGTSTMTRRELLTKTPLADKVMECGCDEVDVDALEATLAWAADPPHAPVVGIPRSYAGTFSDPEQSFSDVIASDRK